MTTITATRQQSDGSIIHAIRADDGEHWVTRVVPWHSAAGDIIGYQVFLLERNVIHPNTDATGTAALELVSREYRLPKWLTGR